MSRCEECWNPEHKTEDCPILAHLREAERKAMTNEPMRVTELIRRLRGRYKKQVDGGDFTYDAFSAADDAEAADALESLLSRIVSLEAERDWLKDEVDGVAELKRYTASLEKIVKARRDAAAGESKEGA